MEIPQLIFDSIRRRHCMRDDFAEQLPIPLAEAQRGHLDGAFAHSQPQGDLTVTALICLVQQKPLQLGQQLFPARLIIFLLKMGKLKRVPICLAQFLQCHPRARGGAVARLNDDAPVRGRKSMVRNSMNQFAGWGFTSSHARQASNNPGSGHAQKSSLPHGTKERVPSGAEIQCVLRRSKGGGYFAMKLFRKLIIASLLVMIRARSQ